MRQDNRKPHRLPTIQNIGIHDLVRGHYTVSNPSRTVLIRILNDVREEQEYPPAGPFLRSHAFVFLDIGDPPPPSPLSAPCVTPNLEEEYKRAITPAQAESIARVMLEALRDGHDVVAHCTAGVSRSGAIVEAAVRMGFADPGTYRAPNARVLRLILEAATRFQRARS